MHVRSNVQHSPISYTCKHLTRSAAPNVAFSASFLNDKMTLYFYLRYILLTALSQFQSHQVQLKEPLPEHLKIKKSKSNEQALQRIKCKLNASTNSEITARILQPDISKHKTTGKESAPQQPAAGNRIKLNSFFPEASKECPKYCIFVQTIKPYRIW